MNGKTPREYVHYCAPMFRLRKALLARVAVPIASLILQLLVAVLAILSLARTRIVPRHCEQNTQ